jgi:CheY-like chemotaxis protein
VKTILVVDDEFGNAEVLGLILEEEGYRVFCAANGRDGLERAKDVAPDLIVVDYMMPIMNGADMGRLVRASPKLSHVKILLHSGLSEAVVREQFDGYDAFLRKPYNVDMALRLIGELLSDEPPRQARPQAAT